MTAARNLIIFIDCEGEPIQELSALCAYGDTLEILSVFHQHAKYPTQDEEEDEDWFSRDHIHGLNLDFLQQHGVSSSRQLTTNFCRWIDGLPLFCNFIYFANDPMKERREFPYLKIFDIGLPPWAYRDHLQCHRMAISAKNKCATVLHHFCPPIAHSSFQQPQCSPLPTFSDTKHAKLKFGYHCSLYDVLELYLYYSYLGLKE